MGDVGSCELVRLNVPVGVTEIEISGDDDGTKVMSLVDSARGCMYMMVL